MSFLVGLAMLVACSKHAEAPGSALRPFDGTQGPQAQGPQTHELSQIDTLMWHHPDSALAVMMEFAGSEAADSMDVFEGHYCQVLIAELLYKNDYGQSNRKEVLKAVHYFDSIVGMDVADARGKADARGASVQRRDAFLAARAHYMNGVGFYERDSVVAACGEYLKALEMVETHFPGIETRHGTSTAQPPAEVYGVDIRAFVGLIPQPTYARIRHLLCQAVLGIQPDCADFA